MNKSSQALLFAALIASLQPAIVGAQEQTSSGLEEIIVTAQKRAERLVDVPMSISVMSGEALEERGFVNVQDLAFAVPGMTMREDGPGVYAIFMRGLSNQYGTGALVGVYLDETPISLTGYDQLDTRYYDMERVEVLKGPQGTLYGQGSVAGAVRYITKKPVLDAFAGSIEASLADVSGGDAKETFTGMVNIPIATDKFALRIAATKEQGGGWQDQPQAGIKNGNDQDLLNARVKALWQITDAFTAEATVITHRNEIQLGQGYEEADRTVTVGTNRAMRLLPRKFDYDLYSLNLTYDFGGFELLSSSNYIDHDHQVPFTYVGGPATIWNGSLEGAGVAWRDITQFSQEVRLASTGEGAWKWTVGAFYRDLKKDFYRLGQTRSGATLTTGQVLIQDETYESSSVFADVAYRFTERFEVGVGVRYFEDDQTMFDGATHDAESFDSVDPRAYASFKLTDDTNVYVSVAKGFRSGGLNRGTTLPNYGPESLISYEIGVKGAALDRMLAFEVAAYYSDYDDMLRRGLVYIPSQNTLLSNTANLGKVEVKGLEGGLTLRPNDMVTLHATAAYTDSDIKEVNALNSTSIAGDPVDYVPELSYTLGARFDFDIGAALPAFVRLDYSYRDKVSYVDRTSYPLANVPQYSDDIGLVDAGVGLTWSKATFELFGTNLSNENKWIDPYHGWSNANRTRPRTVGLKVGYSF
ncbi:TonB-dependent receptor [Steroidobacter sp.]|uniref:TonB-dependent receptor n=1 Tax=Steroidobacter sp. TaxID=1978227 RepID=UPI001A388AE0|nr:TonB-dependent receptor [Steroidobacter sp.]MBL8271288.1 TonB-dependent receptor [Steroidobacter sp.]